MAKCTEDVVVCLDGLFCSVTELCDCIVWMGFFVQWLNFVWIGCFIQRMNSVTV